MEIKIAVPTSPSADAWAVSHGGTVSPIHSDYSRREAAERVMLRRIRQLDPFQRASLADVLISAVQA